MVVGIIRVITSEDEEFLQSHAKVLQERYDIESVTRCIPDQPHGIHDKATLEAAVPKIVQVAKDLVEQDHVDLILISCADDPGIEEVRSVVNVPVIGAGSAAAVIALARGGGVGVLGITEDVPAAIADVLGDRLVASRVPQGVRRTTDLMSAAGAEAAVAAALELRDAGAGSIVFACTGFTTIGLADPAAQATGIPVVDAVLAAGLVATYGAASPRPSSAQTPNSAP